jgi:hypothetical protein
MTDLEFYRKIDIRKRDKREKSVSLVNFLREKKYYFDLTEMELYLVISRILTIYKTKNNHTISLIDYKKIQNDLEISEGMAKRYIHAYQKKLSVDSCEFIYDILRELEVKPLSEEELKFFELLDDDGRHVLPSYIVIKIILSHLIASSRTLMLIVKRISENQIIDEIYLPFVVNQVTKKLIFVKNEKINIPYSPCFFIKGITEYKKCKIEPFEKFVNRLLSVGIENVILFNMAVHPQYSGKKLKLFSCNPFMNNNIELKNEFFYKKMMGHQLGCDVNSATLFNIQHIFCDYPENQMQYTNLNSLEKLNIEKIT